MAVALLLTVASSAQQAPQTSPSGPLVSHVIVDSCSGCGGAALGQTTMAASSPVVIASDQSAVHIVCDSGCGSPPATADNSAFTFGTTSVSPIGFVVDDVGSNPIAENSFGAPRMSTDRLMYVDLSKTGSHAASAAFAGGDKGVAGLAVVNATAGITALEGQYMPLAVDQFGQLITSGQSGTIPLDASGLNPLGHKTDDPFVNTHAGMGTLAVRKAVPVNLSGADGDYEMLQLSAGRLWVDPSGVTLTVGSHAVTNAGVFAVQGDITKLAGTATSVNSGTKDAGTLRVVLATDQPQLTNKLLVTPDSVALPANQSVNVAQVGGTNTVTAGVAGLLAVGGNVANAVAATANPVPVGGVFTTTPATLTTGQTATAQFTAAQNLKHDLTTVAGTAADTNSGTKSAGTLRVVLATDQPALTNKLLVTPDSVALPANQSVNVAQIGGTNTVTGGVAGILAVGGNVANAVAATANPVPVGGIFTTTPTTLTTGQTATAQYTAAQNLKTDLSTVAGTATVTAAAGVMKVGIVGNANAAFDAANNAAEPANVVSIGVETVAAGTQPTAATAANIRRALASTEGVVYVQEGNSNRFSCIVASTATVTTQCQAAPGAGLRAYVTSVVLTNAVITAQSIDVVFGTGAACVTGITALTHKFFWVGATESGNQDRAAAFPTPLVPTAATAICVRPTAATAFGATITGYIAP